MAYNFPAHYGMAFTPTLHNKPEGPTDPKNNSAKSKFVVVVVGAGRGIGADTAYAYANAGASGIVISSRTVDELKKVEEKIRIIDPKIQVLTQKCDVSKEADVKALAEATKNKFGRVDVVIANAGVMSKSITASDGQQRMPIGTEDEDFGRVIDINLVGTWNVSRHFMPHLQATKDGLQALVIISSASAVFPDSNITPLSYNISKFALNRLAEHIHKDHFSKDGVQAFAVHPGAVFTTATIGGEAARDYMADEPGLCGGFLTWLTKEKRPWLSGRYMMVNWDVTELESMKDAIVKDDKLVLKMTV